MAPEAYQPQLCVLLLPRELERFILRDQAEDLLRAPNVVAVDPPRVPYGAFGRLYLSGPEAEIDAAAEAARAALSSVKGRAQETRLDR